MKNSSCEKVFKIAEFHTMSKTDQQAYEDSLKYYRDLKNSLDTAELDGFAKAEQLFLPQLEEERRQKEEERRQKEEARKKILDLAKFLNPTCNYPSSNSLK
jgi:hypothetical protein